MSSTRRDFLHQTGLFTIGGSGLLLSACGGGGGNFPPAGNQTFEGSIQTDGIDVHLYDPSSGFKISVPGGSLVPSSTIKITSWSRQRDFAKRMDYVVSDQAFDITLFPNQIVGFNVIEVSLPWKRQANVLTSSIVAYGTNGRSLVLRDAVDTTGDVQRAVIGAAEVRYLCGLTGNSTSPAVIQVSIAEPKASRIISTRTADPTLTELWSRPTTRKSYSSKLRVAIVTHGILDDVANPEWDSLINILSTGMFPTEGDSGTSIAFDKVFRYGYDWKERIRINGTALAEEINSKYGDPNKHEVFIFAHSMGGLVSRCAIEIDGIATAKQLVTFGTPHLGVPLTILKNWAWLSYATLLFAPGVIDLLDDSDVIKLLHDSKNNNVKYLAVAGTSYSHFKGHVGDVVDVLYKQLNHGEISHDGIVTYSSAIGGPVTETNIVPLNHSQLIDRISDYCEPSEATWISGLNRKIKSIEITPSVTALRIDKELTLKVKAFDVDGDELDQSLIPDLNIKWSVDPPSIVSVSNGVVRGKQKGIAEVSASILDGSINAIAFFIVTSTPSFPNLEKYISEMRNIDGNFRMGRTEVSVAMWKEFVADLDVEDRYGLTDFAGFRNAPNCGWVDENPMSGVSYHQIMGDFRLGYARWASCVSGVQLTLPTESQWMLAATGGNNRNFPWGGYGPLDSEGNWPGWDPNKATIGFGPHPTGSIQAGNSPFGCSDMAGNVWEWCLDLGNSIYGVLKGGGWDDNSFPDPTEYKCSYRRVDIKDSNHWRNGFRLCELLT